MTDSEKIRLYVELMQWWLIILAAWGIPTVGLGIVGMALHMQSTARLFRNLSGPPPPPPFPSFEKWQKQQAHHK